MTMTNKMYYIRGNAARYDEVRKIFIQTYPEAIIPEDIDFKDIMSFYYFNECFVAAKTSDLSEAAGILRCFGKELTLPDEPEPKFKKGDIIVDRYTDEIIGLAKVVCIRVVNVQLFNGGSNPFYPMHRIRIATKEEIEHLNNTLLYPQHLQYSDTKKCIEPHFVPYDKVLVKEDPCSLWRCDFFSHYSDDEEKPYIASTGLKFQCIPYTSKTKHLVGKEDDYKGDWWPEITNKF